MKPDNKQLIKILFLSCFFIFSALVLSGFSLKQSADIKNKLVIHSENDHDALWHIALISSLKRTGIPPENPVFSEHILKNYHYVYDLLLAIISKTTGVGVFWLYLKFAPIFLALFFALTTYLLSKKFFNKTSVVFFATSLSLFGSGFSWIAPFLFPKAGNSQSVFWLDQPIRYGINQQLLLSLILINLLLILQFSKNKYRWLFSGVILGVLSGVKIYGFMVMFCSFVFATIVNFRDKEFFSRLKMLFATIAISMFIVLNVQDKAGFPFIWAPGWFIRTMFEGEDRLNFSTWEIQRQLFVQHNNIPRLIYHFGWGALVFYIGNFGVKIFGVFGMIFIIIKQKVLSVKEKYAVSIFISAIVISLVFPMFFIQKKVVWNSIQFMHYASVPLVILLVSMIDKMIKNSIIKNAVFSLLVLISLPTSYLTITKDTEKSSYKTYDQTLINSVIRKCKTKKELILGSALNTNSFIPAICERSVFFADIVQNDITFVDSSKREKKVSEIENKQINPPKNSIFLNHL